MCVCVLSQSPTHSPNPNSQADQLPFNMHLRHAWRILRQTNINHKSVKSNRKKLKVRVRVGLRVRIGVGLRVRVRVRVRVRLRAVLEH